MSLTHTHTHSHAHAHTLTCTCTLLIQPLHDGEPREAYLSSAICSVQWAGSLLSDWLTSHAASLLIGPSGSSEPPDWPRPCSYFLTFLPAPLPPPQLCSEGGQPPTHAHALCSAQALALGSVEPSLRNVASSLPPLVLSVSCPSALCLSLCLSLFNYHKHSIRCEPLIHRDKHMHRNFNRMPSHPPVQTLLWKSISSPLLSSSSLLLCFPPQNTFNAALQPAPSGLNC